MKKLETLVAVAVLAVCGASLVGCKQNGAPETESQPAVLEKPEATSPEEMLSPEAKPTAPEAAPAAEHPATDKPKDHPAH